MQNMLQNFELYLKQRENTFFHYYSLTDKLFDLLGILICFTMFKQCGIMLTPEAGKPDHPRTP